MDKCLGNGCFSEGDFKHNPAVDAAVSRAAEQAAKYAAEFTKDLLTDRFDKGSIKSFVWQGFAAGKYYEVVVQETDEDESVCCKAVEDDCEQECFTDVQSMLEDELPEKNGCDAEKCCGGKVSALAGFDLIEGELFREYELPGTAFCYRIDRPIAVRQTPAKIIVVDRDLCYHALPAADCYVIRSQFPEPQLQ